MILNFDDENCLIDDSTPVPDEISYQEQANFLKILQIKVSKDTEELLKPPHIDHIKDFYLVLRFEGNQPVTEIICVEDFRCPDEIRETFARSNWLRGLPIHCKKVNGVGLLECDWQKPNPNHHGQNDKIEEKYIKAAPYLPDLLRLETNELVGVEPDQQERFANFKKNYKIQTQWIEYYLLDNNDVPIELGETKPPAANQYRPGKISAKLHKIIECIWTLAEKEEHPLCQWILSFDCPSQVWFILEAILIIKEWKNPLKSVNGLFKSERRHFKRAKKLTREDYKKKTAHLLDLYNKKKTLSLDEALTLTLNQLRVSGVRVPHYQDYLNARTGQIYQLRQPKKRKRAKRQPCTSK